MAKSWNTERLAHIDCPGGGQVWVDGTTLYIGHMRQPTGTTIVDVADPRSPKTLARVDVPPGWHSHKVRVADGIMVVNHERQGQNGDEEFGGGLGIYDVSKPADPKKPKPKDPKQPPKKKPKLPKSPDPSLPPKPTTKPGKKAPAMVGDGALQPLPRRGEAETPR